MYTQFSLFDPPLNQDTSMYVHMQCDTVIDWLVTTFIMSDSIKRNQDIDYFGLTPISGCWNWYDDMISGCG